MRAFAVVVTIAVALTGCASALSVESTAPDEPVTVDAALTEWAGKLNSIDNGTLSVGIQNDGEFLYLSLSTRDARTIAQMMQQGLVVWIDPSGGKQQAFGVRYPIGIQGTEDPQRRLSDDMASNRVRIERSMQEVELIGAGGQSIRRRKDSVPGIEMHAEYDQRVLTYEAKIALAAREGVLYAAGARPGEQIGVGFTTPELEGDYSAQASGEGGLPGGSLSSADGRGRYGPQSRSMEARPSRMSHWMTVTLADGPSQ